MTRDNRTFSAVFMAVLLVLASGTAVSLAVTGDSSQAAGANAVSLQDEDGQPTANVTFSDQTSDDGATIVVDSVTLSEGGFVAIHDETLLDGDAVGSVVGVSDYLEAGTHENVEITLARPLNESQSLIAMPHLDTNENQVYDFVIANGATDGPYTTDGQIVVDQGMVSVGEEPAETTTEEEEPVETTTEEEEPVETTTEEEEPVETTTEEEEPVETTTEEEEPVETTTEEEEPVETTTEEPAEDQQQFIFKIEQLQIDEWSFVIGDSEEPDRTETVSDVSVSDRRVEINLSEVLAQQGMAAGDVTTQDPAAAQATVEEQLSGDIQTVRFVLRDISIENVTFVITAPADMELPEPPMMTTTPEEPETTEEPVETTTEEPVETTTEEPVETTTEEPVETTTEEPVETTTEEPVETTTEEPVETTTEEPVETTTEEPVETTTEEPVETTTEEPVETTTEEQVETTTEEPVETTTEEPVETTTEEPAETTTEEPVETTTEEPADLASFEVSELDAPEEAAAGDDINVSAVISNPNEQQTTQSIAFRLEGTVIARQDVTLEGGEERTVTFEINTTGVPSGEYIHGIYSQGFGDLAVITIAEPPAETTAAATTEADDEETTEAEETETPAEATTTAAPAETTTAEA